MLPVARRNGWADVQGNVETFDRLRKEFDRMFAGPFLRGGDQPMAHAHFGSALAIWEDEDQVEIELDVPGVKESDVDLEVDQNRLSIRVERKAPEGRTAVHDGRSYGRFERVVALPPTIDAEGIRARLADGVLSVLLKKRAEAKPRKITLSND